MKPKLLRRRPEPDDSPVGVPTLLADITLAERTLWETSGPIIEGYGTTLDDEGRGVYTIWQTWAAWADFYRGVRAELYAERPWRQSGSVAERLLEAIDEGRDPVAVLDALDAARAANDPRRALLPVKN